jgi:cytoskeletal protein CcmA (bactofilin family)
MSAPGTPAVPPIPSPVVPPVASPPPAPRPVPPPAAPAPTLPPRSGDLRDLGVVRRDSIRSESWTLSGTGKVQGDVDVTRAQIDGSVSVKGKLVAVHVAVEGAIEVTGETRVAQTLAIHGTGRFEAALRAQDLSTQGSIEVAGTVEVPGRAQLNGHLIASGELKIGQLDFKGRIETSGSWTAASITGELEGASRVPYIRVGPIRLSRARRLFARHGSSLTVDRIDATEAYLENVDCEFLCAERVTLGPGCHIAQVEGKILRQHSSSYVGWESRSPPPHGLSR